MKLFLFNKTLPLEERKARAILSLACLMCSLLIVVYGPFLLLSLCATEGGDWTWLTWIIPVIGATIKYTTVAVSLLSGLVILYASNLIYRYNGAGSPLSSGPRWFNRTGPVMRLPKDMVFLIAIAFFVIPVLAWLALPLIWKTALLSVVGIGFLVISAFTWVLPWRLANEACEIQELKPN